MARVSLLAKLWISLARIKWSAQHPDWRKYLNLRLLCLPTWSLPMKEYWPRGGSFMTNPFRRVPVPLASRTQNRKPSQQHQRKRHHKNRSSRPCLGRHHQVHQTHSPAQHLGSLQPPLPLLLLLNLERPDLAHRLRLLGSHRNRRLANLLRQRSEHLLLQGQQLASVIVSHHGMLNLRHRLRKRQPLRFRVTPGSHQGFLSLARKLRLEDLPFPVSAAPMAVSLASQASDNRSQHFRVLDSRLRHLGVRPTASRG